MKKIFFIAVFSVIAISAFPQRSYTSLQYSMGFGTGNMKDFISKASFRGFTIDYRSMVQTNIGVGVDIGWNVFYQEMPDAIYEYKNITYSGKQWRYANQFPILGAVDYYMETGGNITPYAGLGLGTMYSLHNTDMGTYTFEKDAWHFALRPELGFLINAGPGLDFTVVSKYYYGFQAGDLPSEGYFTINVGFVFAQ
jgi:outer membrane protein